jgi:DNA mismatch repair ATPase MutL
MEDFSLHVLDVAENALSAGADRIEVRIAVKRKEDVLRIEIKDNGRGMDDENLSRALDPFYTTKDAKRVGLGLPLLAQAAAEAGGDIDVQAELGKGTLVRATCRLSHPDLKPLGDMLQTMATLAYAHPDVQFVFEHRQDDEIVTRWNSHAARCPER